ncbi:hypothetical protein LTR15_009634 [Elasticomyces elasticus]|nr:hypothetical protein LTR15_009634 [Elasticomyces elasticus]
MKLTAALLIVMATASLAEQSNVTKEQAEVPSIVRAPLLHLGFAWNGVGKWTEQAVDSVKGELNKVDLSGPGKWFIQASHSIGVWTKQAAKNVKAEIAEIVHQIEDLDMTGPNKCIHVTARYVQLALRGMSSQGFPGWLKQATKELGIQSALHELQYVKLEELAAEVWQFVKDNPGLTVIIVLVGVAFDPGRR